jgi:hypothetical protein
MADLYTPENLERWSSADPAFGSTGNYCGADLSAFYIAPISNGRDTSDAITLSNWRVISAELERLAQHDESGAHSFGHWACGWYELWLIHESDAAALRCADQWAASLADYCVADESDWSELESEHEAEAWENWAMAEWRGVVERALQEFAPDDADRYWADDQLERVSDDAMGELWHTVADRLPWCCQHESDGPSFNFRDAAEALTRSDLADLTGLALLPADQEWRRESYPWPDGSSGALAPALA